MKFEKHRPILCKLSNCYNAVSDSDQMMAMHAKDFLPSPYTSSIVVDVTWHISSNLHDVTRIRNVVMVYCSYTYLN